MKNTSSLHVQLFKHEFIMSGSVAQVCFLRISQHAEFYVQEGFGHQKMVVGCH